MLRQFDDKKDNISLLVEEYLSLNDLFGDALYDLLDSKSVNDFYSGNFYLESENYILISVDYTEFLSNIINNDEALSEFSELITPIKTIHIHSKNNNEEIEDVEIKDNIILSFCDYDKVMSELENKCTLSVL